MSDLLPPEVEPGSFASRLYNPAGDFPVLADDYELSQMVDMYRRERTSGGGPSPVAALTSTPSTPAPLPEEPTDYGGGGDITPEPISAVAPEAEPPRRKSIYDAPISVASTTPEEPETPGLGTEVYAGAARGGAHALAQAGHVASYIDRKLAGWSDSKILNQFADGIDAFVDGLDKNAKGIVPPKTIGKAWDEGYGTFANWLIGKTVEGGVGVVPPLLIGRYAGLPAVIAYGAVTSAVEEARDPKSTNASITTAAMNGAAQMGLPIKVMNMTQALPLFKRIAAQAAAFGGIGAAQPYAQATIPAVRGEGYTLPTGEQVAEGGVVGASTGAALAGAFKGGPKWAAEQNAARIRAQAGEVGRRNRAAGEGEQGPLPEEYGPPMEQYGPLPEEQGPQLPPRPYPPREPPEQYGPDLPPRPYPPREPPVESVVTTDDPAFQSGPKGSPETAPPSVAGDPAATAAIDAAVNPPRLATGERTEAPTEALVSEAPTTTEFRPPPFEDPLAAIRSSHEAWVEQQRQRGAQADEVPNQYETPAEAAGITLNPEQQRTGAVGTKARPETTTVVRPTEETAAAPKPRPEVITAKPDTAGYIETKPLTTEPDHLDAARHVAKDEAGKVVGKGATPDEALADAQGRGRVPYEEAPPARQERQRQPRTEEFSPEVQEKASRSWGDLARDDAANDVYNPPSNSDRARTEYQYNWEQAAGDAAWKERLTGEKASAVEAAAKAEVSAEKSAAAKPGLVRKAQPAAAEEAIAKSQAKTAEPAAKPTTTVVRRPTKRVEVMVGKRGEAVVGEESTAQRETADAAEAAQQRRLAEQRAEKLPARAQAARRTSLMASEAGRDIKDVQEAPATSKVTRGTPIEEVGEGMQIEATEGGIAETRSKTTTDKDLRYHDLLHDVLQGNKTVDQASEAAGTKEPGTRGRPRRNADLAEYLEKVVIPRAEKYNETDRQHVERVVKQVESENKLTPDRQKVLLKRLNKALRDKNPETHEDYTDLREARFEELNKEMDARVKARGRHELERERLEDIKKHRDELRGEDKGGDAEANAPLYRDPDVERGVKAAKRLLNLSINRKLQDRIKRSDETNTLDSAHDYLNDIINDPGAKIAAPDMVELARHLKRLLPDDVTIGGYKALFKNLLGRSEEAAARKEKESAGTYYGDEVDAIGMNPGGRDHLVKTMHELTHAVTYKYLDDIFQKQKNGEPLTAKEQKHADTLDVIVKEATRLRDEAAISDAEYNALDYAVRAAGWGEPTGSERTVGGRHELVTQTMTDPLVREVMGRTQASPEFKAEMKRLGYGEPQNLWQAFKMFVKDIVGFKRGSVLDKVLDPMTDILEAGAKYREDVGMGLELNSPLPGSGGRRWKPGDVPTDGLPSQWVRDKLHPLGEAFADSPLSDKARAKLEGWKSGLARRGTRAIEVASPTHKITAENADVLPAGPEVLRARALIDRATGEYKHKWGNRVQNWVRELRAGPEVAKLMNDATLAETYLTNQPTLFAQRNAHLMGDKLTRAEELQERFNNLTPEKQKLYSDVRDYYRQTHFEQRKLEYEDVVQRFLPEATPDQRTALADKLSTRRGIKEVLADPDVLSQAFGERWENSRALVKEIAKLQDTGWREGDFFPLRRYGDYVLRYGEQGTKDYGVEMFERSSEAAERRAELQKELPAGTHITDVMSKRADFSRKEFMPESALEDMARAMAKRGASEKEIEQAKDAYAYAMMRRQVSSSQAQSRMYRSGVKGASEDASQNLINHFNSTASLFGRLTHGAAETEAMRQARQQADAIERASGTPGTAADIARSKSQLDALETRFANKDPAVSQEDINHARQQHEWLVKPPSSQQTIRARETLNELEKRRAPVDGDDSTTPLGKAAGKFTAASMVYHLIRPAHLAINVADTHANAQSLLGADYGHARAAAALVKAMKDLGPSGIGRGFRNALKAVTGNMEASDWHVGDMLAQKLIDLKPGDTAHAQEMRDLSEMTKDYSLVDHTRSREVQRLSRKGGFDFGDPTGGKYPWSNVASNMMNLFAVGEHTVDSTMRMGVVKAAYDLARGRGASPAEAREEARVHAMDVMPVYGSWNTPRIASPRTPYLRDIAPATMQYKLYGFHMYAVMGGLVRKAMFRPEERAEAIKALTGLVATHSILGGVTANLFALPVVAALGAWDWINGEEKPHNYETDLKRWIADVTGSETASKFASAGLFGLAGAQQSRSLKLTNMVDVPEVRSFDKAGAGQFIMQGMTGASGDVAGQLFEGLHDLANGEYMKAGKKLLPRVLGDPLKAIDLGNEGVVDKRGRTITPASQVTLGQQITQAAGFNPYQPSLARERRHEEESVKDEYQYRRRQAIDRYVLSGGKDMTGVRRYMNDEKNRQISPIKYQQLREALKEERQRERRPEFYGARPTKREERPFREATRFY